MSRLPRPVSDPGTIPATVRELHWLEAHVDAQLAALRDRIAALEEQRGTPAPSPTREAA